MARPTRGKIPQSDWPLIMARYEAGETLSSIGRTYDCSPPAISYVVSRSRARAPAATSRAVASAATGASEPQLLKAHSSGSGEPNGGAPAAALPEAASPTESPERNGYLVQPSAEYRPKRHLSSANGPHPGNGAHTTGGTVEQPKHQPSPEYRGAGNGGNGGCRELRVRVEADMGAFLAAFDAALADDTQENRSALREATDRLLRAGARTRIELERLEVRTPLPRRNPADRQTGWQYR
jgi:hypothetical protein